MPIFYPITKLICPSCEHTSHKHYTWWSYSESDRHKAMKCRTSDRTTIRDYPTRCCCLYYTDWMNRSLLAAGPYID